MAEPINSAAGNEVLELIDRHRTIRVFRDEPIPPEHLSLIFAAARKAPTDATAQMYSFLRVTDRALRQQMAHLAGDQTHIAQAAEFFIVCADVYRIARLLEHRADTMGHWPRVAVHFALVDAALAAQTMVLAAESLGYGICYIGGVLNNLDAIARALKLPAGVLPAFGLCLGVPDEQPARRPRVPERMVIMENEYRLPSPADLEAAYEAMRPITRKGDWYAVLRRYFARGGTMEQRESVYAKTLGQQGFDYGSPGAERAPE